MEKLYDSGKARAIGVSNFSSKKMEDLLAVARVPPAVNQVECHLIWQQDKLRKLCHSRGVHLSVSSISHLQCCSIFFQFRKLLLPPFADNRYCTTPICCEKLPLVLLQAFSPLGSPGSPLPGIISVLSNPIVISVAEKLQKTPAQVALRWGLQMGQSILPKSTNEARIKENFDIFDWSIPKDLMAELSGIKQERLLKAEFAVHPLSVYKTLEDLWDGEI
ncbi:unnamed protein product [Triticum turgidum subsp. durum]|uniref:NADP-dependent oxidoreductase domain-containing protein n=1 Tax=Triticum turgidum subsp. durum TaxID=4567 RepID=A0A9R0QDG6_TRITD|nr:unnamed protein product [Triticum turgidum subsp. durum]